MINKNQPIGVFDSGMGGLTVLKQLVRFLPNESFVYLGDTARVPYGNKSPEIIRKYTEDATKFLLSKDVKMIVIACNTVSSIALDTVKAIAGEIQVVGMIDFSAIAAYRSSRNKNIGVIGTKATISSNNYEIHLKHIAGDSPIKLYSRACPLFVPIVEELMFDHPATKLIAEDYLKEFKENNVDTLILGCTHYPALSKVIADTIPEATLIDTGEQSAIQVLRMLAEKHLLNEDTIDFSVIPKIDFFLTDFSANFRKLAENLLGFEINNPKLIEFLT